ncbi:MAG: ABC transporter transmembrane domain-containing protein, partial [Proteobacteria bacterium]|nr:ABC transporter transmembrane domain-containing protein [Pseudomonadota bacterium]
MAIDTHPAAPEFLREEIPEDILFSLTGQLAPDANIRVSIEADIRFDGTYGPSWLLVTDTDLLAISSATDGPPDTFKLPLSDIVQVEVRALFGSGILKVRTADSGATVAYFSRTLLPKFSKLPAQIETLVRQARPTTDEESIAKRNMEGNHEQKRRCEKCGQVIPRWMGVCPVCLDKRKLLLRLLSYSLPYWKVATVSLILLLTATFIGLTPPLLMRSLIDDVLAPAARQTGSSFTNPSDALRTPSPSQRNVPLVPRADNRGLLGLLVGLLLLINLSRNGLGALRTYLLARLGQRITFDLRSQIYRHLHHLSLSFYNERETGRIMASITQDVNRLQDFISDGLQEVIRDVATILIICVILFSMDASLAILVLLPTPLLIIATLYFGEKLHDLYHGLWRRWAGISAILADTIPGVRVVKAFAQEKREVSKFESQNWQLLTGEIRVARLRSVFSPVMTFLTSLGTL